MDGPAELIRRAALHLPDPPGTRPKKPIPWNGRGLSDSARLARLLATDPQVFPLSRACMRTFPALILGLCVCAGAAEAPAQCTGESCEPRGGWEAEASTLAVNALLGGVAAGTVRLLRSGSFLDGFAVGAAGGALVYAGKRIAVEPWDGAGLAGREVAAVGTSIIRNTADGRPPLQRLVLPVWIGRLYVTTGPRLGVQPRLDLLGAAATAYQAVSASSTFDLRRTLSSGAPVFRVYEDGLGWLGFQRAGVVLLRYDTGYRGIEEQLPDDMLVPLERSFSHERVHVVQLDQAFLLLTAPAEDWILEQDEDAAALHRWIDPGVLTAVLYIPELLVPYERRPWEREADFLARAAQ